MSADVEGGPAAAEPVSMGELLSNKGVLTGCTIFLLQQFSGINAIVYFSSSVFAQVLQHPMHPQLRTGDGLGADTDNDPFRQTHK